MTNITCNYQILEKVGEGAMSEVFKATDLNGNLVALKILRQFLKDNVDCIERIKKESEILNKLDDEKIVKSIRVERTNDSRLMLVQEFIEGKNLEHLINLTGKKPIPVIASILVSEILLGLEEAHRQGVIHRDLKPENILITPKGNIKIADFGVAKNLESQELTITGLMLGSPAYMSPEQIKNLRIDGRSDIFSIGVLLYQLATGELPFLASNYAQLIKAIEQDEFKYPTKVNGKIHPELARIIKKSLIKNPSGRYQKVYEFRYDLLQYLDLLMVQGPRKILKEFYEGNLSIEDEIEKNLIKTIIIRAKKARSEGDKKEAIDLLSQALTIEPMNNEAKKLLKDFHKSSFISKRLVMISLVGGLLISFVWMESRQYIKMAESTIFDTRAAMLIKPVEEMKHQKVTQIVSETKSSLNKGVNLIKEKPYSKLEMTKTDKRPTPLKDTKIVFHVDSDVTVFLDDIEVARPYGTEVSLNAGKHLLRLEKPDYAPISSYVNVPSGEVTTINAKTTKVNQ